jgi:hypothetical protein
MNAAVRCGILGALLMVSSACSGDAGSPTAPTPRPGSNPPLTPDPVPQAPAFPPVTGPARIYVADASDYSPMHGSLLASRYVLYDNGPFALQYASVNYPFFEYLGGYRTDGNRITFYFGWEGWSSAGPSGATGWLTEEFLDVRYNLMMQHADFVNGLYIRVT